LGLEGDGTGLDGAIIRCAISSLEYVVPEPAVIVFMNEADRLRWQPHADALGRPCMLFFSPDLPWKHRHLFFVDYTGEHIQEIAELKTNVPCHKSLYMPLVCKNSAHFAGLSQILYHCSLPFLQLPTQQPRFVKMVITQLFVRPAEVPNKMLVILASEDPETQRAIRVLFDDRLFDVHLAHASTNQPGIYQTFQMIETQHPDATIYIVENKAVVDDHIQYRLAMRFRQDKPVVRIRTPEKNFIPSLEDARPTAWVSIPPMPLDQYTIDLYRLVKGATDPIMCYRMVTQREDISDAVIYYQLTGQSKAWAIHQGFHAL